MTYSCLEYLKQGVSRDTSLKYFGKLREGKVGYDEDLREQKNFIRLAARHDSLSLVFGATKKESMQH